MAVRIWSKEKRAVFDLQAFRYPDLLPQGQVREAESISADKRIGFLDLSMRGDRASEGVP